MSHAVSPDASETAFVSIFIFPIARLEKRLNRSSGLWSISSTLLHETDPGKSEWCSAIGEMFYYSIVILTDCKPACYTPFCSIQLKYVKLSAGHLSSPRDQ